MEEENKGRRHALVMLSHDNEENFKVTYNFDAIIDRINTNCVKWEFVQEFFPESSKDALPLWVADMDFACAPQIVQALHNRVERQIFGYSHLGANEYIDAVTGWFKRRFAWDIDRKSVFYSPGVVPAVAFLLNALTQEGDGIIIQRPVYYPFTKKIEANNRKVVNNALIYRDGGYVMDFEDLEAKASNPDNKVMILCSPHNPCGRVWTPEELKKVVEICKRTDTWIISDEIHCDIVRKHKKHYPLEIVCPEYKDRIVTCTAPSKSFNLAGLQISNIIINNVELRRRWLAEVDGKYSVGSPNCFAITAVETAYNHCEDWLEAVNDYIDENMAFAAAYIEEHMPMAEITEAEGTYLLWIDFSAYESDAKTLEQKILKEANVVLDEGYIFGEEGNCFERINVACPRSILAECLARIKNAL